MNVLEEPIACLITYVSWLFPKAVAEGFKLSIIDNLIFSFLYLLSSRICLERVTSRFKVPFSLCVAYVRVLVACLMVCFNEVLENLMRECYILHFSLSLSLRFSARSTSPRAFTVEIQRSSYN